MPTSDVGSSALVFVVLALASYRIARIATEDSLTLDWRRGLRRWAWTEDAGDPPVGDWRSPTRSYIYVLLTCPLCLSVWIAALAYVAWINWSWSHPPLVIMAIAGLQAFLALKEDGGP